MTRTILFGAALAGAAVLSACDMPSGETERQEAAAHEAAEKGPAGAEGKAEEGRLSIRAPGVDIAINVPEAVRGHARANANSEFLPQGSEVSGIHVQGDGGDHNAGRDSVELRFAAAQPPAQVAAWYRDPARRQHFTIAEAAREGEGILLTGTTHEGAPIRVHLMPRAGGTDGRLVLVDRD
jgi:hypothetical protein